MIQLIKGDCLVEMQNIPDKSIDAIICDLPYGTTQCKWDTIIPFDKLWAQYKRIIKDNGAIVLFGSQPFTSALVMSNTKWFKYEIIWNKKRPSNPMLAKKQMLKVHENIIIFSNGTCNYFPQGLLKTDKPRGGQNPSKTELGFGKSAKEKYVQEFYNYPKSIQEFGTDNSKNVHPAQKSLNLIEMLVKTYTNEGDIILDNCMGSGTTGVACKNLNRNFIGIEMDDKYFEIAKNRIQNVRTPNKNQANH